MVVEAILFLVLGLALLIISVLAFRNDEYGGGFLIGIFALALVTVASLALYRAGTSAIAGDDKGWEDNLEVNQIYETMSAVKIGEERWVAILRDQEGDYLSYFLPAEPPKIFKRLRDDKNTPVYQPFPGSQ